MTGVTASAKSPILSGEPFPSSMTVTITWCRPRMQRAATRFLPTTRTTESVQSLFQPVPSCSKTFTTQVVGQFRKRTHVDLQPLWPTTPPTRPKPRLATLAETRPFIATIRRCASQRSLRRLGELSPTAITPTTTERLSQNRTEKPPASLTTLKAMSRASRTRSRTQRPLPTTRSTTCSPQPMPRTRPRPSRTMRKAISRASRML